MYNIQVVVSTCLKYLIFLQTCLQVPIAELDTRDKVVGLYFFQHGPSGIRRTKKLLKTWDSLKANGCNQEFEIIFVYANKDAIRYFPEDNFIKMFGCANPWYKLPINDNREVSRLFRIGSRLDEEDADVGYFIIFKPDKYEPISYFAFNIMETFGAICYPFTMESAVNLSTREERKLKFTNLLSH